MLEAAKPVTSGPPKRLSYTIPGNKWKIETRCEIPAMATGSVAARQASVWKRNQDHRS